MIVVDASILVQAASDRGPRGGWCRDLMRREPMTAPQTVLVEACNGLRKLERRGRLEPAVAGTVYADLLRLPVELSDFPPFAVRVWQLRHNLSPYDAWYVALAESLGVPLATLDQRLAGAPGTTCQFLLPD